MEGKEIDSDKPNFFRIYRNILDKMEFTLVVIDAVIVEKSKKLGPLFAVLEV